MMQIAIESQSRIEIKTVMSLFDPQGNKVPESPDLCRRAGTTLELLPEEGELTPPSPLKRYVSHLATTFIGEGRKRASTIASTVMDPETNRMNCVNWKVMFEQTHTLEEKLRAFEAGTLPFALDDDVKEVDRALNTYNRKHPRVFYLERRVYDSGHVVERRVTQRYQFKVTGLNQTIAEWK